MTLSELLAESGMSPNDYAYALGVSKRNLLRWIQLGTQPDDVYGRALQIAEDGAFVDKVIKLNPDLLKVSYKHFKYRLDDGVTYSVE
jgi:hypothetical protein